MPIANYLTIDVEDYYQVQAFAGVVRRHQWSDVPSRVVGNTQRILDLLTSRLMSSRELAELLGISERQIEDHLTHLVKSVRRDRTKRFLLEPSECR